MSRITEGAVHLCSKFHHLPATAMCVLLYAAQAGLMDYYLIHFLDRAYVYWVIADVVVLLALVFCIVYGYARMEIQRSPGSTSGHAMFSTSWVSWLLINVNASVKMVIIVKFNAWSAESDPSFFGPNVFKTAIAMGSCIFIFLLTTQHDAPLGSRRRSYISDLTGTVVFDILDTVDILEVFFAKEDRQLLWGGLEEMILTQASLNLILPTVPLVTLSLTHFGLDKPKRQMIYLHRLLVVLVVNIPNLLTRLILWHGMSLGISPFTLKNIVLVGMTLYEFYEHKREKIEEGRPDRVSPADLSLSDLDLQGGHRGGHSPGRCSDIPPPESENYNGHTGVKADECIPKVSTV